MMRYYAIKYSNGKFDLGNQIDLGSNSDCA